MITNEKRFEEDLESFLLSAAGGYTHTTDLYDPAAGLYVDTFIGFVKKTQPKEWTRFENTTDLKRYPSYIEEGMLPTVTKTEIGPEEEMFETVMLGLRMVDGVSLGAFAARFGIPFEKAYPEACRKLSEKGWLELTAQRAKLTKQGLLMQNSALMEFME